MDVDTDMALPKDSYTPMQILLLSKGSQMLAQQHTPVQTVAEQKSILVLQSKFSPPLTRQRARQVKLFADTPSSAVDSVLLVTPCDEYFPCVHFDELHVSMNVSATPVQPAHMFFPDTISASPTALGQQMMTNH